VKGPKIALATDIGTEATGRSLALHLTMTTFRSGSSTIQLTDFKRLKQASETVKKYAKKYRLQIKGYTDNREAKKNELELSWERARKVKEYLNVSCGIPNDRMEIVGYGSRLPLAPETSAAGRAKNRRVEVVLIIQK
jgi:OmpA-OmpF porin, OOP family